MVSTLSMRSGLDDSQGVEEEVAKFSQEFAFNTALLQLLSSIASIVVGLPNEDKLVTMVSSPLFIDTVGVVTAYFHNIGSK